ncbi:GtrA family protein [Streptomyces montanisoli]|uniref:GtrA family protein n=1 Tax=Streptomyces montanisoli TaxID=2798581 RepID=UPI0035575818
MRTDTRTVRTPPQARARAGLASELVRFALVGGAGVLVNLLVFNLLRHSTHLPVVRASIVATVVSIGFNYLGFRYFAYRECDKSEGARELTLFLLFSAAGLVIENGTLYTATYGFGWHSPLQSNVFKFLGIGLATLFRFWSYRSWVFRTLPGVVRRGEGERECVSLAKERARGGGDGGGGAGQGGGAG